MTIQLVRIDKGKGEEADQAFTNIKSKSILTRAKKGDESVALFPVFRKEKKFVGDLRQVLNERSNNQSTELKV